MTNKVTVETVAGTDPDGRQAEVIQGKLWTPEKAKNPEDLLRQFGMIETLVGLPRAVIVLAVLTGDHMPETIMKKIESQDLEQVLQIWFQIMVQQKINALFSFPILRDRLERLFMTRAETLEDWEQVRNATVGQNTELYDAAQKRIGELQESVTTTSE